MLDAKSPEHLVALYFCLSRCFLFGAQQLYCCFLVPLNWLLVMAPASASSLRVPGRKSMFALGKEDKNEIYEIQMWGNVKLVVLE
jgi:hypothetical protein